jgi:hypothetical protein
MKVTPDIEAPTIPMATIYQGDFLLPMKKPSLSAPLLVKWEINRSRPK